MKPSKSRWGDGWSSRAPRFNGPACHMRQRYFVKRRCRKETLWNTMVYHRYPKLGIVSDVTNDFTLAFQSGRTPCPDVGEFKGLITQASKRVPMKCIIADAGYDSEPNHAFAREQMSLRTIIPAQHGRPTNKPAKVHCRRLMQARFGNENYCRRSQVKTVMSMIKQRRGSFCKGKTYWSRCREVHRMALAHNIMILWYVTLFYGAGHNFS